MFNTLPKKQETVAVTLSNTFGTYNSFAGLVFCTNSVLALMSPRRISLSVRGVAEITTSKSL